MSVRVQHLLRAVNMEPDQYQMGSTKVFVKNPESVSVWERQTAALHGPVLQAPGPSWAFHPRHPQKPRFLHLEIAEVLVTLQDHVIKANGKSEGTVLRKTRGE